MLKMLKIKAQRESLLINVFRILSDEYVRHLKSSKVGATRPRPQADCKPMKIAFATALPGSIQVAKPKRPCFGTLTTILFAVCVLVALVPTAHARAFDVTEVTASIANERLELEFNLDLSLSDEAVEALNHGIALYIIVEVELRRKRRLKRDSLLERSRKDVEIRYHGLSRRYLIQESGVGTVSSHLTVEDALNAISSNRQVLIPVPELPTNQSIDYLIAVRTRLNNETLPNPLRFISKLLPSWRLDSGWTKWPVRY